MPDIMISEEKEKNALEIISNIGLSRLMLYTVILINEKQPLGSAVLVINEGKKYLVTAAHVIEEAGIKYKKIGIVLKPDDQYREIKLHSTDVFDFKRWDCDFRSNDLLSNPLHCRDLAAMEIPPFFEGMINATKEFINIKKLSSKDLDLSLPYCWLGLMNYSGNNQINSIGVVLEEKKTQGNIDFYVARALEKTICKYLPSTSDFSGMSGSGLFQLDEERNIQFAGIAFYQNREFLSQENGYVEILFYGPNSILKFFEDVFS